MGHNLLVVLFAVTAGFTASGIVANLYRLVAGKPEKGPARIAYVAVMVVAGPSVLFENAAQSRRKKSCSAVAFWIATAIASYWSFALGLTILAVAVSR